MIYDQHVDMHDIHAPTATEIIIRSKAGQSYKSTVNPDAIIRPEKSKNKNYTSGSAQRIDIDKFTQRLQSITSQTSSKKCAKSIRVALESAGAQFKSHPIAASDWGNTLMKIGIDKLILSLMHLNKGIFILFVEPVNIPMVILLALPVRNGCPILDKKVMMFIKKVV